MTEWTLPHTGRPVVNTLAGSYTPSASETPCGAAEAADLWEESKLRRHHPVAHFRARSHRDSETNQYGIWMVDASSRHVQPQLKSISVSGDPKSQYRCSIHGVRGHVSTMDVMMSDFNKSVDDLHLQTF